MNIVLYILRLHLTSVYFFIKIFTKRKKQVFLLSRQYNKLSLNYHKIIEELEKENIRYKVICKKLDSQINDSVRTQGNYSNFHKLFSKLLKNLGSAFKYYFSLYKQMRYIALSKVVIVDGYNLPVSLLKHKKGTKIIQLWHALGAVKQFGYQTIGKKDGINPNVSHILKMHENYDYVISGSKEMNKYFAKAFNVSKEKVLPIGTPTYDYMKVIDNNILEKIYIKYPILKKKLNVLYSPTFRNSGKTGIKQIIENFDFNKCNLIITSHPKVKYDIKNSKVIYINPNEFSSYDIVKLSDYVITDYSSLMIDAAIANKKILLYVYDYEDYKEGNGLNIDLLKEYPNITKKRASEILKIISDDTYDMAEFQKFKDKYTINENRSSLDRIITLIKECLN